MKMRTNPTDWERAKQQKLYRGIATSGYALLAMTPLSKQKTEI